MSLNFLPEVQEKILSVFLSDKSRQWYINELIRKTGEYPNSISYALKKLKKSDLLKDKLINNKRFYFLNKNNPLLKEIESILVKKGLLKGDVLRKDGSSDWIKLLNREASLAFQAEVPLINRDVLPKVIGYSMKNFWFNGLTFGVYYKQEELKHLAEAIHLKIKKDKEFVKKNINDCYKFGDKLIFVSSKIKGKNLGRLKDKELLKLFLNFRQAYQEFLPYLVYPHAIERYFIQKIEKELEKTVAGKDFEKAMQIFKQPVTHEIEEQIKMLKTASVVKKEGLTSKTKSKIKALQEKYCWQPFWTINTQPLSFDYYKNALLALAESKKSLEKEVARIKKEQEERKKSLKQTLKKVKASKGLKNLVEILQGYINIRTYRKNIISKAHFLHLPLLLEVGRRMGISDDIKLLGYDEIYSFLKDKKNISKLLLRKRKQGWGVIAFEGQVKIVSGLDEVLEVMEQFQIGSNPIPASKKQVITGNPACRGKVKGKVRIIQNYNQLNNIKKGDVLVTSMTTPEYVPVFTKIKGIITDEGGVTCHAAIVSREYSLPCIVGTGNATKLLKDGDRVELDAGKGVIKILETDDFEVKDKVQGKTLYKGKVEGKVLKVKDDKDLKKADENSILLAGSLGPRFLSALYKVKGFIVDEYSPTSHAYLYAQTFKIPSIGGTKNATKILKTGDKISLNASKGLIKLL